MQYTDFARNAYEKLMAAQDALKAVHNIDRYKHWFYNQSTELLRLYNDDVDQVYLKYIPVGTYSPKEKTWMWCWDNKHSGEQSKFNVLKVKEFGEREGFDKLSDGYFSSDEYDGWEFIAISMKFLGGIGGYRAISSDGLWIYFLITRIVDLEEVKKLEEKLIECPAHGKLRYAFICQHLSKNKFTGFEEAFPTYIGMPQDEEDDFQAWCDECEKVRARCDGWNDESMEFAGIKLVCERCYFEIKEFNSAQSRSN